MTDDAVQRREFRMGALARGYHARDRMAGMTGSYITLYMPHVLFFKKKSSFVLKSTSERSC
jgi:hypothetical protein